MGVGVARSMRLPLATAEAGRWARIGLRQNQTHSVRPATGCVGRRLAGSGARLRAHACFPDLGTGYAHCVSS